MIIIFCVCIAYFLYFIVLTGILTKSSGPRFEWPTFLPVILFMILVEHFKKQKAKKETIGKPSYIFAKLLATKIIKNYNNWENKELKIQEITISYIEFIDHYKSFKINKAPIIFSEEEKQIILKAAEQSLLLQMQFKANKQEADHQNIALDFIAKEYTL